MKRLFYKALVRLLSRSQVGRDVLLAVNKNEGVQHMLPRLAPAFWIASLWLFARELAETLLIVPVKLYFDAASPASGYAYHFTQFNFSLGIEWISVAVLVTGVMCIEVGERTDVTRNDFHDLLNRLWWGEGHHKQLTLPWLWHINSGTGKKLAEFVQVVDKVSDFASRTLFDALPVAERVLLTVMCMPIVGWMYSLIAVGTVAAFTLVLVIVYPKVRPMNEEYNHEVELLNEHGAELVASCLTIKMLGQETVFADDNRELLERFNQGEYIRHRQWRRHMVRFRYVSVISKATLFYMVARKLRTSGVAEAGALMGSMVLALQWMQRIYDNFDRFVEYQHSVRRGWPAFQSMVREFLMDPLLPADTQFISPPINGAIQFSDVTFAYNDKGPALQNVSFQIKPGETVALVGDSGGGKSTVLRCIAGAFFIPDGHGQILIDGVPVQQYDPAYYRRHVGVVDQEMRLFNRSVRENIRVTDPSAPAGQEVWAAEMACLTEVIADLDGGYDFVIGDNGGKLSGGQRQRLAIARAIFLKPAILLMDEPTSALDSKTERCVQNKLTELMYGRTTIIAAHRLSTIEQADTILVFEHGRLVEQGTPAELKAKEGGHYRRFRDIQLGTAVAHA